MSAEVDAERTANQDDIPKQDAKESWEKTKDAVSGAAHDAAEATKDAYQDIKATILGDDTATVEMTHIVISTRSTANGIIGKPVHNGSERVGTIDDIILDSNGKAVMVVVADGDFFGMGKLAAFDYGSMVKVMADGDVIMPLTEGAIDQAAEFSYNREDSGDNVRIIPSNGYSAKALLDGQLIDTKGETLAEIDDIHFRSGMASQLVVGFDKTLGLGGEKAAIGFNNTTVVRDGDDYDFQLSANKAVQFESYKKAVIN